MAGSAGPLGRRLDAEWEQLVCSPQANRAVARWARLEPAIAGHTTLEQLRGAVHHRGNPDAGDRILAALVRLAAVSGHGDQLAARVVLQLLIPGAVRLGHTLAPQLGGDRVTSEAMVFAELTIGVRTYPWQRRPHRIAANLLLDTRQRLTRRAGRHSAELPAGLIPGHPPPTTAAGRRIEAEQQQVEAAIVVDHLLWWAQRRRIINAREAWLLLARYRDDTPIEQLARVAGLSRSTAFALRAGAEQRLREALTGRSQPGAAWASAAAGPSTPPGAPDRPPTGRNPGPAPDRSTGQP